MSNKTVLFIEATPVPGFKEITCYEENWTFHIISNHPEVAENVLEVRRVISDPSVVFSMASRAPSNVVFLNETVVNAQNEPLFVAVNKTKLSVLTAYYKAGWRNFSPSKLEGHSVIWTKL